MCYKREGITLKCEFCVQSNALSKSRIDGIKIGGNDLPRRMTTSAKRWMLISVLVMMVLMLITMTIITLIMMMAMMVMMMKCIDEYDIGKNDHPHRVTMLTKRRMLISVLVMMVMMMRLTTMTTTATTATTTTTTTMMMMVTMESRGWAALR